MHLGHQAVLRLVRELADARGLAPTCVTFDRHPAEVVRPESAPKLLTTLEQKLELLDATGCARRAACCTFDEERSHEPAEDFVREVLVEAAPARGSWSSAPTSTSATSGAATSPCSSRWAPSSASRCSGSGWWRSTATPTATPYSSTRIRELLADGDVAEAARLARAARTRCGAWSRGATAAGRELGFPTANVAVPDADLPARRRHLRRHLHRAPTASSGPAAISLGRRPTFYEHAEASLLEAYVLDFDGDLYGQPAKVRFAERLRGEERFESVEALVEQMATGRRRDPPASSDG